MIYPGFIGPSYVSRSRNIAVETLFNWMPQSVEVGNEPSRVSFSNRPGLSVYAVLDHAPLRGLFSQDGQTYAVGGQYIYSLTTNAAPSLLGQLTAIDKNPVSMSSNGLAGNQLYVASGGKGNIVNLSTGAVSAITASGYPAATPMGAYLDSYFLTFPSNTAQFNISGILDGTAWSSLDFDIVVQSSDNVVALIQFDKIVWLVGSRTSIPYYDSGAFPFPFQAVPQVLIETGTCAPFSVCKTQNAVCWLHRSERGQGQFMASGSDYSPRRLSTFAIEDEWSTYPTLTDAVAFTMSWRGHDLVVITFQSGNATWVYDFTESALQNVPVWGRWSWWDEKTGAHDRFRGWVHCKSPDGHLVGDWETGVIYLMDDTLGTDADAPIVWERIAPHVNNERMNMFHSDFQVDMETGLGGNDPTASLSWSDDGGHTFRSDISMSTGALGAYATRCRVAGGLGQSRDRVYRLRVSNNVPQRPFAAYLSVQQGTS